MSDSKSLSAVDIDVAVIGGGPAGATAAQTLAEQGHRVLLLDREGRIKPCGGAVPPKLLSEFDVPETRLEARVSKARMVAPSEAVVDMDIGGFVGMVDRGDFDPWLRQRAASAGATRITGVFESLQRDSAGALSLTFREGDKRGPRQTLRVRAIVGADGAASRVREQALGDREKMAKVFAYHEIVRSPAGPTRDFDPVRCDVYYQGEVSPDFYGWVFPHGGCTSVGAGSAVKGFSLRAAVARMRERSGLADSEVIRTEGAPLPLKPLRRWDNGADVLLVGDAAGTVAPSSGEGIYYGMSSGRHGGMAVSDFLESGDARMLRRARRLFMAEHRFVFLILGIMQRYWYTSDKRREKFVKICRDPDVQRLTWESYMNKKLVRARPTTHMRIFMKDLAHLVGLNPR
jgi:geranylgeranyl reductase